MDLDEAEELISPVSMGELESTIKWFKNLGPDGWNIEFYLAFHENIGPNLLKVVEECKTFGCMYEAINSTFIALIPKSYSPSSFNDFQPISLCHCLYKIISKIIANHLKPVLSCHISPEQFSFFHNKKIHEAIGSTQEALHSMKTKRLKRAIVKIDLAKAFDWVSWLYIKMVLTHLGFPLPFIDWIMCCITSTSFSVLISGSTSHFFHVECGLWQGRSLSPLLFLIVMEGLSRLIASAKQDGRFQGLKIT